MLIYFNKVIFTNKISKPKNQKIFLIVSILITTCKAFAQYGPIPYKTPSQTIGDKYIVLDDFFKGTYTINKTSEPNIDLPFKEIAKKS